MAKFCVNCGNKLETSMKFCSSCGVKVGEVRTDNVLTATIDKTKSRVTAGILAIFLGFLGVHNFYLGYNLKAVGQLLLTLLTCGVLSVLSGIWGLIEGIMILTGTITLDAKGNKLED